MEIRKAKLDELDALMAIYDGARAYMRENGNAEQWGNGYPSKELIRTDIETGHCHVCVEDGELLGYCYFSFQSHNISPCIFILIDFII